MNKKNIVIAFILLDLLVLQFVMPYMAKYLPTIPLKTRQDNTQTFHTNSATYKWTYIGYFCADNNLDEYGVEDINELEEGMDNSANVSVIAIIDRYNSGAKTYRVQHDTSSIINSPVIYPSGILNEPNMGDDSTLEAFLTWVLQNYPAEHYILDLWDHGGGWFGICFDDTSGQDGLSLAELRNAIQGALSATGEDKIDIITMDACLMGMLECSYYLEGLCDVFVASEEVIYAPGYPYSDVIGHLCQFANTYDVYQMASVIVDDYRNYYSSYSGCTLSAVNLSSSSYNQFTNTFASFAESLYDNLLGRKNQIRNARIQTQEFYYPFFIDLYDFCKFLEPMDLPHISSNATEMMNVINNVVINYAATGSSRAKGISIYFPEDEADYRSSYGSQFLAINTLWENFLNYYYTAPDIYVDISGYYTNETINQGKTIELTVKLKNTGSVSATQVEGSLHSNNPNVTVSPTNRYYNYGGIDVGQESSGSFIFNVSPTIENLSIFFLYFNLSCKYLGVSETIYRNISLYFMVGKDIIMGGSSFSSAVSIPLDDLVGVVPGPGIDRSSWYKVNVPSNIKALLLNLTSPASSADFDMYIYSPSGSLITVAISANFPDFTSFTNLEPGDYRIKVHPYSGEGIFILYMVENKTCDDGNSVNTAYELILPANGTVSGSLPNSGNSNGYLFYRVLARQGQVIVITLNGDSGTDFDIYLCDYHLNVLDQAYTAHYPERLAYRATESSVYYIVLVAYSGSGSFTMEVKVGEGYAFFDWINIILIVVIVIIVIIGIIIYWKFFT
ncbi:MAG: clostripain-related cysteine peptidase [Candidatus Helarchaeota archaeon]